METHPPDRANTNQSDTESTNARSPRSMRRFDPNALGRVFTQNDHYNHNQDANKTISDTDSSSSSDEDQSQQQQHDDDQSDQVMDAEEARNIRRMIAAAEEGGEAVRKAMDKEERKQREQERQRKLLAVTEPLDLKDKESFLGYALVNIVEPHDGGKGPELIPSPFSRPHSTKQLRKLKTAAGEDGSGLRTRDFEHAVVIALPRGLLDEAQLTQSPYGPHRRVQWTGDAVKKTMTLLAGSHRQQVSDDLTKEHQREILKLQVKADKASSKGEVDKKRALERKIRELRRAMEPRTVWLAMLYDKDSILDHQKQYGPALLKLITNNRIPPQSDTEEHDLSCIFRLAFNAGKATTPAILNYITTLNQHRGESYRRLAQRGGDFLLFLIKVRASKHFDHFFTDSAKILSVQHDVWGLVGPLVEFMWLQLLFPCSDIPLPPRPDGKLTEDFRQEFVDAIRSRDATTYLSTVVLDVLVELADSAFNEHLSRDILYVGTKSAQYWEAYTDYAREIVNGFREALRQSRTLHPELWTEKDVTVAEEAPAKLRLILFKQAACRAQGSPVVDSSLPLFTPMCGASILDDWLGLKEILYMISTWFTPNLSYIQNLTVSGSATKLPIKSYPGAIRLFLETWLGYRSHRDWSRLDKASMLREMFDPGLRGDQIVDTVFNLIVRILWRHRESILRPAQRVLPHLPRIKSSSSRSTARGEDPEFEQALLTQGVTWIKLWLKDIAKRSRVWEKDVTPQLDPILPLSIRQEIQKWQDETGETRMMPIFEALQSSLFNFLVSPTGSTNNKTHHQNQLLYLADEYAFYQCELIPALRVVTPVANLYHELVSVVRSNPELANARFWADIPEAPDAPKHVDQALYTKQLVRKDRGERLVIFEGALLSFVKRISKSDCLGIMVNPLLESSEEDGENDNPAYKLHLAFIKELQTMCRRAKVVSHQLSVINHSPKLVEWPVVEDEWYTLEPEDPTATGLTTPLPICGIDDLLLHYQDDQVQAVINGGRGNAGLVQDALDEDFGLLPCSEPSDEDEEEEEKEKEEKEEEDEEGEEDKEEEEDEEGNGVRQERAKRVLSDNESDQAREEDDAQGHNSSKRRRVATEDEADA